MCESVVPSVCFFLNIYSELSMYVEAMTMMTTTTVATVTAVIARTHNTLSNESYLYLSVKAAQSSQIFYRFNNVGLFLPLYTNL